MARNISAVAIIFKLLGFDYLKQLTHSLHCTSNVAAFDVSFPRLFSATHRYCPLSVLLTFLILSCFSSSDKLILELLLVSTGDLFMVHDIVGTGFPVTLQNKITFSPSVCAMFRR